MTGSTDLEVAGRLLLAALLGGVIGLERQIHGRPAGLRTHLLVCVASALLMSVSEMLSLGAAPGVRPDPGRIAAGAITGMGFLGAGVILKIGASVHGLTTAACLWMVAAIGLAVGVGLHAAALVSFVITILALWLLRRFEERIPRQAFRYLRVTAAATVPEDVLREAVTSRGAGIAGTGYELDAERGELTYRITVSSQHHLSERALVDALAAVPQVRRVEIHD